MPSSKKFQQDFDDDSSFDDTKSDIPPLQRNAANARERARMRVLSRAFGRLKTKLPNIPPDTKLSKLDTLRLATLYIKQLKALTEDMSQVENSKQAGNPLETRIRIETLEPSHTQSYHQNVSWPFAFQHMHINRTNEHRLSLTNWVEELSENLQEKDYMCPLKEVLSKQDLFENTDPINDTTPDVNNSFDGIQSQQQFSPFVSRSHFNNYHPSNCSDHQRQNIQIL